MIKYREKIFLWQRIGIENANYTAFTALGAELLKNPKENYYSCRSSNSLSLAKMLKLTKSWDPSVPTTLPGPSEFVVLYLLRSVVKRTAPGKENAEIALKSRRVERSTRKRARTSFAFVVFLFSSLRNFPTISRFSSLEGGCALGKKYC